MQTASSWNRTPFAVFTSNDDNHYTTNTYIKKNVKY